MGLGWRERGGNQSKANGMKRIIQNKYAHEEGHREYGGCDKLTPLYHRQNIYIYIYILTMVYHFSNSWVSSAIEPYRKGILILRDLGVHGAAHCGCPIATAIHCKTLLFVAVS